MGGLKPRKEEWVGMLLCLMFLVTSNVWFEESIRNRKDAKIWRHHRESYSQETVETAVTALLCGTGHFVLLCMCALVVSVVFTLMLVSASDETTAWKTVRQDILDTNATLTGVEGEEWDKIVWPGVTLKFFTLLGEGLLVLGTFWFTFDVIHTVSTEEICQAVISSVTLG